MVMIFKKLGSIGDNSILIKEILIKFWVLMNIKKDIKILLRKIEEMTGEMREEIVIREDLVQTIE